MELDFQQPIAAPPLQIASPQVVQETFTTPLLLTRTQVIERLRLDENKLENLLRQRCVVALRICGHERFVEGNIATLAGAIPNA